MKVKDLTMEELKDYINEVAEEKLVELLGDPDWGLELKDEVKERLKQSLGGSKYMTRAVSLKKIMEQVPPDEIKEAVINEYKRRLIRYKIIDEMMKKKYKMSFSEFEARNLVKEKSFSWDIESDAMEWEHAIEGIRYIEEKLRNLETE